jgi:hypothetical protein
MRVFNEECIFISLEECFCTVFCKFFKFIIDCTCTLADQSRNAGIVYEHHCLCPGYSRTIVALRIPSCILSKIGIRLRVTQTFKSPSGIGQRNQAKASGLVDFEREHSSKVNFSSVVNMLTFFLFFYFLDQFNSIY